MDKVEFKLRLEEIEKLIDNKKYPEAAKLADTIDWRNVKSVPLLIKIAELYRMDKKYEKCKDILEIAYDRNPNNKSVLYNLCEIYSDFNDLSNFMEACKEYVQVAGKDDIGVYTLKYILFEMQNVGIEEKIQLLEELKKKERIEKWEYELAYLYHRAGFGTKCVEECDELILWFGDGPFVTKAMELKMLHEPLTPAQQQKYNRRNEAKFQAAIEAGSQMPMNEELDFRVKTVDLNNKFSTINLQAELAENVKDYLDITDEIKPVNVPEENEAATKKGNRGDKEVFHETIPADVKEVFFADQTADIQYQIPAPEEAESLNNPEMAAFREEFAKEYAGKEPTKTYGRLSEPSQFDPYLSQGSDGQISMAVPQERVVEKQITGQMNIEEVLNNWEEIKKQNTQRMEDNIRKEMMAQTGEIFKKYEAKEDDLLKVLRELESDKPVPKVSKVVDASIKEDENQKGEFYGSVTGMIPGSIWKEVDELQAAEEAAAAEAMAEAEAVAEAEATAEAVTEEAVTESEAAAEAVAGMEALTEADVALEDDASGDGTEPGEESKAEEEVKDGTQLLEEEVERALSEDQEKNFNVEEGDSVTPEDEPVTDNTADIPLTIRDDEKETAKMQLSREVKELFAPFLYSKRMKKQIVAALEKMSLAAYTANIVISSDQEESGRNLATTFVKYMKQTEGNFSGQVAKVKAERLNQIDVTAAFDKVVNGAMIIENANTLSSQALTQILQTLNQEEKGFQVILVDRKSEVKKLMARSPYMKEFFNCDIEVIAMSTNMLVEFGEKYAFEQGYAIDSMGLLAMNKRIDVLQVGMHVVTMGEVKEIVDEAIESAERSKVGRSLTRKRKNDEGMILLLEKDFEK